MRKALAGELDGVEEGCPLVYGDNLLDDDFVVQAAGADDVRTRLSTFIPSPE